MLLNDLKKSGALEDFELQSAEFYNKESKVVKEAILTEALEKVESLLDLLSSCESPIEKLLVLQLDKLLDYNNMFGIKSSISCQVEVDVKKTKYRTDIWVKSFYNNANELDLIIECDGHEFHEKTKEQAAKDKKRDRDLTSKGLRVIRFTGSEIYNDASECAWEVVNIIEDIYKSMNGGVLI